jgi:hypothetical protein
MMHATPSNGDICKEHIPNACIVFHWLVMVQVNPGWRIVEDDQQHLRIRRSMRTKNFKKVSCALSATVAVALDPLPAVLLFLTNHFQPPSPALGAKHWDQYKCSRVQALVAMDCIP